MIALIAWQVAVCLRFIAKHCTTDSLQLETTTAFVLFSAKLTKEHVVG